MVSSLLNASISKPSPSAFAPTNEFRNPNRISQQNPLRIVSCRRRTEPTKNDQNLRYSQPLLQITVAASLAIVLCSNQAHAGILSGFSGLESVPGPQLPQVDFLTRFNEENQKKYAENDARFRESPLLKKLLEQSKLNKEKNRQEILDKYCIRGAEWGVGDCSAEGMSPEDKDKFIAMLKQKAGVE